MRFMMLGLAAMTVATGAAAQDRDPGWLRKPRPEEINAMIPEKAIKAGISGKATVVCVVTVTGALTECAVKSETPADMGFGNAALLLAPSFMMTPRLHNGVAIPGKVSIPINFEIATTVPGQADLVGRSYKVVNSLPWSAAPTSAEMAAAFPEAAKGKMQTGQVVLRCHLENDGSLSHCDTASENPRAYGFAKAARSLVGKFRTSTDELGVPAKEVRVDLPFHFVDPATDAWKHRHLGKPTWDLMANPEAGDAVYPGQAIAANIAGGRAIVLCAVAVGGALSDCKVDSETPAGYGFGDAGVKVASVFKMRPWTDDGMPVDGLKVLMPIQLDRPDETAASKAAPTPATKP